MMKIPNTSKRQEKKAKLHLWKKKLMLSLYNINFTQNVLKHMLRYQLYGSSLNPENNVNV